MDLGSSQIWDGMARIDRMDLGLTSQTTSYGQSYLNSRFKMAQALWEP